MECAVEQDDCMNGGRGGGGGEGGTEIGDSELCMI